MTIEEMRRAIREKVVPEEVVPQNVINLLIDDEAEPPKLDAFAFLMRLRTLGIGSADFLNLLEGCDAPESVINKIKRNPAMNLQGLILTLENSELTSEDYTRMLLTARQVWERTLTLRLEKTEKISREIEEESANSSEDVSEEAAEDMSFEEREEETEEDDLNYDEDMTEMSFTAVLDKISEELRDGTLAAENIEGGEADGGAQAEESRSDAPSDAADATEEGNAAESGELSFTAAFDKIKSEKQIDLAADTTAEIGETDDTVPEEPPKSVSVDTTAIIQIDEEMLRENFGRLSAVDYEETSEQPLEEPDGEIADEPADEADIEEEEREVKTAKRKKSSEQSESEEDDWDSDEDESGEYASRTYHKGAIIGGAVGAAVLVGAGFFIGNYVVGNETRSLHYAEDSSEIFNKIYHAYDDFVNNNASAGGEAAYSIGADHRTIFGDLLIGGENDKKSLGSFSVGNSRYLITEEAVSASVIQNGTITALEDMLPPENARFVAAFDDNGELYALFSGNRSGQSGYIKIANGKADYTVRQDGILTDYVFEDGEMRLGTVYTPNFTHTFFISDEDVYLPKTGTDEPKPISPQKVVMSDTKGFSYGVSAGYSAENGELRSVCAVIGDPVAASADGRFALNGENGLLVKVEGDKLVSDKTERISRAAFCKNGCAVVGEKDDDGSPKDIRLLDRDFKLASVLTGLPESVASMWFDGGVLTINGENSALLRAECSDLAAPNPLSLKAENGFVVGQSALTYTVTNSAIIITRNDIENGASKELAKYTKELPAEQLADVKFGGFGTAITDGAKSGIAYSYFDGVSVISEYVVFENGAQPKTVSVFDDKTGFTAAFKDGDTIKAVCGEGVKYLK